MSEPAPDAAEPALADIERAFLRMCFDAEPSDADLGVLHGDRERWLMYRRMVRHRLYDMIAMGLPRTKARLGDARFDADVAAYLEVKGVRSRFIREVVGELLDFATPRWRADATLPPHLVELASYEALKWAVSSAEWEDRPTRDLDFEAPAVTNPTARTLTIHHRVDKDGDDPPRLERPHLAVVYRRPGSDPISTYVLNDVGGRLYVAWATEPTCADGARKVLADLGRDPDEGFIDSMAGVLADLVAHGVILGSPAREA